MDGVSLVSFFFLVSRSFSTFFGMAIACLFFPFLFFGCIENDTLVFEGSGWRWILEEAWKVWWVVVCRKRNIRHTFSWKCACGVKL
jgi:hypothetical protein